MSPICCADSAAACHLAVGRLRLVDRDAARRVGLRDLAGDFARSSSTIRRRRRPRYLRPLVGVVRCRRRRPRRIATCDWMPFDKRDRGRLHRRRAVAENLEQRFHLGAERRDRRGRRLRGAPAAPPSRRAPSASSRCSVTSSWVETQPPPGIGLLMEWTVRPSPAFTASRRLAGGDVVHDVLAVLLLESPSNSPLRLRCSISSRSVLPGFHRFRRYPVHVQMLPIAQHHAFRAASNMHTPCGMWFEHRR